MSVRLYVGNLSFNTMEGDLQALFSQAGTVTQCNLITDKFTGKSRGFAFVEMNSREEAERAIAEFNGKELDGRTLRVNEARPRDERPRRDYGDGGGFGGGGGGFGGGGGGFGGGGGGGRDRRHDRGRRE